MTPNNKKLSEKALLRELHFEYRMIKERNKYENIKIDQHIDNCMMQISAYSMKGKRCHMEDFYDIGYMLRPHHLRKPNEWPYEYFYFGVFDGHGGREAACYAKKNLLKNITEQKKFWSEDDEDVKDAIREGFAITHKEMKGDMPNWSRTKWALPSTAGTTASVLFIKNGKFYTGHVGDSRIVISKKHPETKDWLNEDLTVDQKPENETKRIEAAGGEVKSKIGVHRVVWNRPIFNKFIEEKLRDGDPTSQDYLTWLKYTSTYPIAQHMVSGYQIIPFLAIARSLGDFWSFNQETGEYMVSPVPDVSCRPIDKNDKCILLATDGLWNVMSSSLASRLLQELKVVKNGKRNKDKHSNKYFATDNFYDLSIANNESNHALSLVYMAYQIWERRRLRSDNITAVVAMLGDILGPIQEQPTVAEAMSRASEPKRATPYDLSIIMSNTMQLGDTKLFFQNISLTKRADVKSYHDTFFECELLENLEHFLVFPPTVFGDVLPYLIPPQNYTRLANAETRKLERDACDHETRSDSYIYIKEVSDDPQDSVSQPTRFNKKGKEVRDSSSQATQAMHDFGQPWNQLTNDQPSLKKSIIPRRYRMRVASESKSGNPNDVFYEDNSDSDEDVGSDEEYELVYKSQLKKGDVVILEDRPDRDGTDEDEEDDEDEDEDEVGDEEGGDDDDDDDEDEDDDDDDDEEDDDDDDDDLEDSDEVQEKPDAKVAGGFVRLSNIREEDDLLIDGDMILLSGQNLDDEIAEPVISKSELTSLRQSMSSSARSDDESDSDLAVDQVLSVVSENKTPLTHRTTRRSATENSKRKHEIEDESSPKSKRRRSHPIHTAVPTRGC